MNCNTTHYRANSSSVPGDPTIAALIAPAGYGKSTAIRGFLQTYSGQAFVIRTPPDCESAEAFRQNIEHPLQKALAQGSELIVLDDLHNVRDDRAFATLAKLIDASRARTRWLLGCRSLERSSAATWTAYDALGPVVGESALSFSLEEARECAALITPSVGYEETGKLFALSRGWPALFTLAQRTFLQSRNLGATFADASVRSALYSYLNDHVIRNLSTDEMELLSDITLFDATDVQWLRAKYATIEDLLLNLRSKIPLISIDDVGKIRCEGILESYLRDRLSTSEPQHLLLARSGAIVEQSGDLSDALSLFVRARAIPDILRILHTHGHALLETRIDLVDTALAVLDADRRSSDVGIVCLRGSIASRAGEFARSDALFEKAASLATSDDERNEALHRFVLDMLRRNKAVDRLMLEATVDSLVANIRQREHNEPHATMLSSAAASYAMLERMDEALPLMERALRIANVSEDAIFRATVYHQASFVAYRSGDFKRAAALAVDASDLARKEGLWGMLARSYSVRYGILTATSHDPSCGLDELTEMAEAAAAAHDEYMRLLALSGIYAIHTTAGNDEPLETLREKLLQSRASLELSTAAVAPADAMRSAWIGDFRTAYVHVAGTEEQQTSKARRGLRLGEIAIYAAACGEREAALDAIESVIKETRYDTAALPEDRRRYVQARSYAAIACVLVGHSARASTMISELERKVHEFTPIVRSYVKAARAVFLYAETRESMDTALRAMDELHLGGVARVINALPIAAGAVSESPLALLTKTEIIILRAVAQGATSVRIAEMLDRSTHTVNVHVASILRKLNCANRRQAIDVARAFGLVP